MLYVRRLWSLRLKRLHVFHIYLKWIRRDVFEMRSVSVIPRNSDVLILKHVMLDFIQDLFAMHHKLCLFSLIIFRRCSQNLSLLFPRPVHLQVQRSAETHSGVQPAGHG